MISKISSCLRIEVAPVMPRALAAAARLWLSILYSEFRSIDLVPVDPSLLVGRARSAVGGFGPVVGSSPSRPVRAAATGPTIGDCRVRGDRGSALQPWDLLEADVMEVLSAGWRATRR